jgi:flagellin-like protein
MKKLLKSKKALSPVVAAIILIAVTVAVSIAVAVWMGSLSFNFMATENLSITKVTFASNNATTSLATVSVRNTGTTDVIITDASVIGYNVTAATVASTTIGEGTSGTVSLTLTGWWVAGNLYNIELLSSKGNQFSYAETA